jgi:hypothetical protein
MTTPRRAILLGICLGLPGALAQLWLIHLNSAQSTPMRAFISITIAALIGVVAGLSAKTDAVKSAALTGFVAGVFLSAVGFVLLLTNPSLIGQHPFASAESTLAFASSVMAGTAISSWMIAGMAVLVALPISLSQIQKDEQ